MNVVILMTVITACICILESRSKVTGFATYDRMLTNQGEITQLMVESYILQPPGRLAVTGFALLPLLIFVCIFVFMAAITRRVGFFIFCICLVAGLTAGIFMGAS